MCTVSMVGDHYNEWWKDHKLYPGAGITTDFTLITRGISREEFESLKKEVENMKKLLQRAKEYDEKTGQPDCEMEDKMAILRKLAQAVDIDLDEVLGHSKK